MGIVPDLDLAGFDNIGLILLLLSDVVICGISLDLLSLNILLSASLIFSSSCGVLSTAGSV